MENKNGFQLTKTQMIALNACQKDLAMVQQQLRLVQQEIGLDLTKQYTITPEGVVSEVKQEVKDGIRKD